MSIDERLPPDPFAPPRAPRRGASDDDLVRQVRAGSERAFEVLVARHRHAVLRLCRRMLGSREEAEDAVQLTFLAAYQELTRPGDRRIELRPWLHVIARHRCLWLLRAHREHPVGVVAEPARLDVAAEVAAREELGFVISDVARLPADQRTALVLATLGDVGHDEIAAAIGCRRGKVKSLVFQARASLTAGRTARETPCAEIRAQLATLRGGALRRSTLRRHLHDCSGCREYAAQVRARRTRLGVLGPLGPWLALRRGLADALLGSGGEGAALTVGGAGLLATALATLSLSVGLPTALGDGDKGPPAATAPHAAALFASRAASASPAGPPGRTRAAGRHAGTIEAPGSTRVPDATVGGAATPSAASSAPTDPAARPAAGPPREDAAVAVPDVRGAAPTQVADPAPPPNATQSAHAGRPAQQAPPAPPSQPAHADQPPHPAHPVPPPHPSHPPRPERPAPPARPPHPARPPQAAGPDHQPPHHDRPPLPTARPDASAGAPAASPASSAPAGDHGQGASAQNADRPAAAPASGPGPSSRPDAPPAAQAHGGEPPAGHGEGPPATGRGPGGRPSS